MQGSYSAMFLCAGFTVFPMFSAADIQELKEVFNVIDRNRDGFLDKGSATTVCISGKRCLG